MSDQREQAPPLFSEAALSEATRLGELLPASPLGRDEVSGFTIAGPSTNACNTAIWIERTLQGGYTLLLSIVDVGTFVTPSLTPALDDEAKARAFAHYVSEGVVVPLLPPSLSEGSLSLLEGQLCPTITLSIPLDASFQVGVPSFLPQTFVCSRKQLTYEAIDQALANEQEEDAFRLRDLVHLALNLWRTRVIQGAIASYELETGWVTTEDGVLILLAEDKRSKGYILEQEIHILANQLIASYLEARDLPALYRNHAHTGAIKAIYAPAIDGHAALNVTAYIHATSPLRSYVDLINQRILLASLKSEPTPYTTAELEVLADPLNAKEATIKAAKWSYFRGVHDALLQERLEREPLASLNQKHFHSVIRKAAEDHVLTPEVAQEITRRLEHSLLKENDLYVLLFDFHNTGGEWEGIQQVLCLSLLQNPSQAVMIYNRGKQVGKWDLIRYDRSTNLGGAFQLQVTLLCEEREYTSSVRTAFKREQARQRAIADALARIAGAVLHQDHSEAAF